MGYTERLHEGGKTKLLHYDKFLKAITVDVDVIPDKMEVTYEGCEESDFCFPLRNVMDENTLDILENPIGLEIIRNIPGIPNFKKFKTGGDRRDIETYPRNNTPF